MVNLTSNKVSISKNSIYDSMKTLQQQLCPHWTLEGLQTAQNIAPEAHRRSTAPPVGSTALSIDLQSNLWFNSGIYGFSKASHRTWKVFKTTQNIVPKVQTGSPAPSMDLQHHLWIYSVF